LPNIIMDCRAKPGNDEKRKDKPAMTIAMTPEQKEWQAQLIARHDAGKRALCALLGVWRACAKKPCRRAHACRGNPHECFQRCWPHVPAELKDRIRAAIKARKAEAG
jgi:hypothetical protein